MSLYKTFLLLSRRHHPCKLPLPTMTFSPGTKKHPVLPSPPPLLSCQHSGLGLGNGREKSGLGGGSHCLPACHWHNPWGCHTQKKPCPRLVPWQLREEGTTQHTVGAGGGPGKAPPRLPKRVTQKPWQNSTLTYFDVYTNQLFSDSTCAEPYCVFMFLFKREVYLAIIINK